MKRISKFLVFLLILNLLAPGAAMAASTGIPDMSKVHTYLLEDNEVNGSAFVKWGGDTAGNFSTNRVADRESGGDRDGSVRELAAGKLEYVRNYLLDETGAASGDKKPVDYGKYNYFSFWYRGDGTANTLTMIFKYNSATNVAQVNQAIPADTAWHYISYPISEILTGSRDMSAVETFTIKVADKSGRIYLDDLMLSAEDPLGSGTEPTEKPTEKPTDTPTDQPAGGPDLEGVGKAAYVLDNNEDGAAASRFVQWLGNANFGTNRFEDDTMGMVRELKSNSQSYVANKLYHADGTASSGDNPVDFSAYRYLGFWYRGSGTALNLSVALKDKNGKDTKITVPIGTDTDWRYFCYPLSDAVLTALTGLNFDLGKTGAAVYLDDLLMSVLNPLDPSGGGTEPTEKPTEKPTDTPTEKPGDQIPAKPVSGGPDMSAAGEYLLDNNEDGSKAESFVSWRGGSLFQTPRTEAEDGWVRKLQSGEKNYLANVLTDGTDMSGTGNLFDYSKYQYFSFWYRGDGTANTLTLVFKSAGNTTAAQAEVSIKAGDTDWHYYSKPVSGLGVNGNMGKLEGFNVKLESMTGAVYVDDLLLSTGNPQGGGTEPTEKPTDKPGDEIYGRKAVFEDAEAEGNRHVSWDTLEDAKTSVTAVGELLPRPDAEAAEALGNSVLKFSAGSIKNYISSSRVVDSHGDGFKAAMQSTLQNGGYKYFSFWYRTGENVPAGSTLKLGFRYNTSGNNHANIAGATFEQKLEADQTWRLVSFPVSAWDKNASVDRLSISIDPAPGKVCDVYIDMLALSEKDPCKGGVPEPTETPKPTETTLAEGELCRNGDVEIEESLSNTYYQYRTEGSNAASAPKFFQWMTGGRDGAPAVRQGSSGSHFLKVRRRAEDGSATNNNQSVWYKYQNKGIPVKPGHTYRISNYVYVEGSGSVAVKHMLKFTNCPPGAEAGAVMDMGNMTIQQGVWQKMVTDYYVPVSGQDDPEAEYTLMFAPYVADCDQAGTRNVVFYLDDFSAMEVKPDFTLTGPDSVQAGQTAKYSSGRITNQWGDRIENAQTVIRYDLAGADGILPQGAAIDQEGNLTVPAGTVSFRALVRASLVDQQFAGEPILGPDLKNGHVTASRTAAVSVIGSAPADPGLMTQNPADYTGAAEVESEAAGAPTAFEGGSMFYADMAAKYAKGITVTEGVPYRVNAYVYVPGTGSAQMKFAIEGAGNVTTQAVDLEKGKWQLLSGVFALPVSQLGAETQRRVTVSPILTQEGGYYFDNLTMFRVQPEIRLPEIYLMEEPGCTFKAAAQDQWGYSFEDAAIKYQLHVLEGSGQGISVDPSSGSIAVSPGAPTCRFEIAAGITYDSGASLIDPAAKNIIARESRAFQFFLQSAVDGLLTRLQDAPALAEFTKILLEEQSEGYANTEVLGLDMTAYNGLTQRGRNQAVEMLYEQKTALLDKLQTAELFGRCVQEQQVMDALNGADEGEIGGIILHNAELLGVRPEENPYYADVKYTAANNAALAKDIMALNRAAEFPAIFAQTVLYSTFNAIGANDKEAMHQFLTDNRETLNISGKYFQNPDHQVKFLAALCDAKADSYGQLSAVINRVINDLPIDQNNGGGNGNSGSRPGGGGGGFSGGNTSVFEPEEGTPSRPDNPLTELYFDDLTEDLAWAKASINRLADQQIVNGVGERNFEPNRSITREEFLKIAMLAFGVAANEKESTFSDLDPEGWYFGYVASAEKLELIQGKGDGTFGLGETITRQDMTVMAYRIAQYAGLTLYPGEELPFTDSGEIADYAAESVSALFEAEVMNGVGDGRFAPLDQATRAMACRVIDQLMQKEV